jgi:hypothetical protein
MRPVANFALHAIVAACLAALAASSAAADDAIGAARFSLTIDGVDIAGDHKQHIDLLSYSFGDGTGVSKVDGFTVKQGVKSETRTTGRVTGLATDPSEPAATSGHSMLGASDRVTIGGARTESGPGTLTINGSFPGCKVGQHYPRAQLSDGSVRFTIDGVRVTSCGGGRAGAQSASFSYARLKYNNSPPSDGKVKVRGWDPERKEQ